MRACVCVCVCVVVVVAGVVVAAAAAVLLRTKYLVLTSRCLARMHTRSLRQVKTGSSGVTSRYLKGHSTLLVTGRSVLASMYMTRMDTVRQLLVTGSSVVASRYMANMDIVRYWLQDVQCRQTGASSLAWTWYAIGYKTRT